MMFFYIKGKLFCFDFMVEVIKINKVIKVINWEIWKNYDLLIYKLIV